jgi:hypothetical protein
MRKGQKTTGGHGMSDAEISIKNRSAASVDKDAILKALWPSPAHPNQPTLSVWGVLDCARDPRIYRALLESRLEFRCLYSGKLDRLLEMNAPHLVELFPTNRLIHTWIDEGWGQSWGIFIRIADSSNLRHHLRKFLLVQDESGRKLLMRYYDPRVLGMLLRIFTDDQLIEFNGEIHSFLGENDGGASLDELRIRNGQFTEFTVWSTQRADRAAAAVLCVASMQSPCVDD